MAHRKIVWPMALSPGGMLQIIQVNSEVASGFSELQASCGVCWLALRIETDGVWRCRNCRERFDWVGLTSSGASRLQLNGAWADPRVIKMWMRSWIGIKDLDLEVSIDE